MAYIYSSSTSFNVPVHKSDKDCLCFASKLSKFNRFCLEEQLMPKLTLPYTEKKNI